MTDPSIRWRRAIPVATLAMVTAAGLAAAGTAAADPLGPSGPAKGAAAAAVVPSTVAGCTVHRSLTSTTSDDLSCIGVGAKLSTVPALGTTATLTVTVRAGRAERGVAVTVDLPPTLAFADGTSSKAAVTGAGAVQRAGIATVDLAAGATQTFTRTVKAVRTGFGEIGAKAAAVISKDRTDGGADYVHLTVGGTAASSHAGLPAATGGDRPTVATTAEVVGAATNRPSVALPAAKTLPTQRPAGTARPATAGTSCVTGRWVFVDQAGVTRGVGKALIQVWRSGGSQLASGYADGVGNYTVCYGSGNVSNTVYVRFVHTNPVYKVVNNAGNDYAYVSGTQTIADNATGSFGTLQPSAAGDMRALHAYLDASTEYDWIYQNSPGQNPNVGCWSPYAASCFQLVVHWQADNPTGSAFDHGTQSVTLGGPDADSEDVPVHEYGHALMWGLYGNTIPATTNCGPHFLLSISSTTCAWVEGFADWVDTAVWGNTIYTFPDLSTTDFNRTWNDGSDSGDQVEGRVVQAFDSLNDGIKYPFDNISGPGYSSAAPLFSVMRTFKPSTFADYWSDRAAAGQDVSQAALSALYQGTIDYGFRNPLTDGQLRVFPMAVPPHNYSATTTRSYWSAVAIRPGDGGDSDLSLYNDAAQSSLLGSSSYGGSSVDFVAVNSNSGARSLQTYYPRVSRFASNTAGYYLQYQQGSSTFSSGTQTVSLASGQVIANWDSSQTAGVPVYYRAVPSSGQTVGLAFLNPGGTVVSRGSAVNSAVGAAGSVASLTTTPTASGFGGLVLINQGLSAGNVTLYADTTAPNNTSISIAGGASSTHSKTVALTLGATDADTGVVSMQISTDGTFDTEPVVPYSTSASTVLGGANGTKTVYVRFLNNAGMWSASKSDTIKMQVSPQLTSITPSKLPTAGGTKITIVGVRLLGTTKVAVDGIAATNVIVASDTKVVANVPAHAAGTVSVRVTNVYGTSAPLSVTYVAKPSLTSLSPSSGPSAGGTTVTITGSNFGGASTVMFGNAAGTNLTVVSSTKITVKSPNHAAGTVDVVVTTPGGTTAVKTADHFTFT